MVGLFKLSKAVFFGALAAGALKLVHQNVGDLALRAVDILKIDPEGRLASLVMDKADMISSHHLRQAGMLSFAYACVCVVEGIGLMLEKTWAEYFTLILTISFLPWELYELARRPDWFRLSLLLLNLAVLWYLVWLLRRKGLMGWSEAK